MNKMRNLIFALLGLVVLAALAVAVAITLSGCQGKKEVELPFETIERADSPGGGEYYEDKDPRLVIIAKAAELDTLGNTVSSDAQTQLRNLDFDRCFAIAVFQGWRPTLPTPRSGIEVQRLSKEGSTITIYAHVYEPVEGYEQKTIVTSPYHLVKTRKGEDMQGEFEFVLNVDGTNVVRQTHLVP
jgi:hypothetical protein